MLNYIKTLLANTAFLSAPPDAFEEYPEFSEGEDDSPSSPPASTNGNGHRAPLAENGNAASDASESQAIVPRESGPVSLSPYQLAYLDPESQRSYQYLATMLGVRGRLDEATACYRRVIGLGGNNGHGAKQGVPSLWQQEADQALQQAETAFQQGHWQEAIAHCQEAVVILPDLSLAYKVWGNALQRLGRLAEAKERYEKALDLDPNFAEVYANLGSLYAQQQAWSEAVSSFQRAIALRPDFAGAFRNLARAWSQLNKHRLAADCRYRAMVLDPGMITAEEALATGDEMRSQGRLLEAERCYRRAVELEDSLAKAHHRLAEVLSLQDNWQEAVIHYRKAILLNAVQPKPREGEPEVLPSAPSQGLLGTPTRPSADERSPEMRASTDPSLAGPEFAAPETSQSGASKGEFAESRFAATEADSRSAEVPASEGERKIDRAIRACLRELEQHPDSAELHTSLGNLYAQQRRWDEAIAHYHQAIDLNPNHGEVHRNLARVLTLAGRRDEATMQWFEAVKLAPNWAKPEEKVSLGEALLNLEKVEEAIACFRWAVAQDATCKLAYRRLAAVLMEQESKDEAIALYRQMLEHCGDDGEALFQLGQVAFDREQWDEAVGYFARAVKAKPDHWYAHHQLGDACAKLERWEDAVAGYERAIGLNSEFSWSHNNLGDALMKLERWEAAAEAYRRAIELNPEFAWSHHNLGDSFLKQSQWNEAASAYQKACELDSGIPETLANLGLALSNLGQLEAATASIQKAIDMDSHNENFYHKALELKPSNVNFYLSLGNVLAQKERLDEAVTIYKAGLQVQPDNIDLLCSLEKVINSGSRQLDQPSKNEEADLELIPVQNVEILVDETKKEWEVYHHQGDQFQIQGKLEEAILVYHQVLIRNPSYSWAYHNLGDTQLKLGKWDDAAIAYRRAIKLNPDYFWSHYNLAVAYTNADKWHKAIEAYRHSIELNPGLNLPRLALRDALVKWWNALFAEGDALLRQGNRKVASELYRKAIFSYRNALVLPELQTPREVPQVPVVLLIVDDFLPQCLHYRVQQKIEQLEFAGVPVTFVSWRDAERAKKQLHFSHVVVFYRVPALPETIELIEYAKAIKKVVFYEIDDLIFDEDRFPDPIESYGGKISVEEYQGLVRGTTLFKEAMALCDYAIASTPSLSLEMEKVVSKSISFLHRNALDSLNEEFLKVCAPKIKRDYVSIFYGSGTKAHDADFAELIAPALAKVLENYQQVRVILMGHVSLPQVLERYKDRIDRIELVKNVEVYWEFLRQADINIAVLNTTPVNNCKSELKWFEAACLGIPSVVSKTQTYAEVVRHGEDGFLAKDTNDWFECLEKLVVDEELRQSVAKTAQDRVWQEYGIPAMANNIKQVIASGVEMAEKAGVLAPRPAKIKILIVNVFFPPQSIGGATRIVRDNVDILLSEYSDQYSISVFTSDDDNPRPYQISEYGYKGVQVTKVSTPAMAGMDWRYQDPQMYEIFSEYLKFNQPDLIHFHCVQRLTASVLEAAADLDIPYLVTVHDAWWISDHQFLMDEQGRECDYQQNDPFIIAQDTKNIVDSIYRRRYLKQRLDQASAVLAVSEAFTDLYRQNGITQTQPNRNGIMPRPVLLRKPSPTGKVRLAHVGGMAAHKGYYLLKEAVEAANLTNCEIVVVDHAQTVGTVRHSSWGSTPVTFVAKIKQEEMHEFYSTIDVLVAPSMWPESFGLVTREAAAAGVWVVASNKGALAEDLEIGTNGSVFSPDRKEELVSILMKIDREHKLYQASVLSNMPFRKTSDQVSELASIYKRATFKEVFYTSAEAENK